MSAVEWLIWSLLESAMYVYPMEILSKIDKSYLSGCKHGQPLCQKIWHCTEAGGLLNRLSCECSWWVSDKYLIAWLAPAWEETEFPIEGLFMCSQWFHKNCGAINFVFISMTTKLKQSPLFIALHQWLIRTFNIHTFCIIFTLNIQPVAAACFSTPGQGETVWQSHLHSF